MDRSRSPPRRAASWVRRLRPSPWAVVVRGPLGVGKTTVARALARAIGRRLVSIDPLLEYDRWDGGSERLFLRANRRAVARARPVLARGTAVVVEGNFYWSSALDDLRRRLPGRFAVFRLAAPLAVCVRRDRLRPRPYGAEAAAAVYAKAARVRRGIRIDATLRQDRIVRAIVSRLVPRPARRSRRRVAPTGSTASGATARRATGPRSPGRDPAARPLRGDGT